MFSINLCALNAIFFICTCQHCQFLISISIFSKEPNLNAFLLSIYKPGFLESVNYIPLTDKRVGLNFMRVICILCKLAHIREIIYLV